MSNETDIKKGRKPDYINSLFYKDAQGKDRRMDIPNSWQNEDGRIVTKTPLGDLIQTPIEKLEELREKKAQAQERLPLQSPTKGPNP